MPQDFPQKDNTTSTESSEMLRLVVEHVVSDVSKDRNVFYFKGHVKAWPWKWRHYDPSKQSVTYWSTSCTCILNWVFFLLYIYI